MKFFILFFLFLSFSCHAGVWYYGSGEAVNLENVMGFQNEPAKIEVDGYYVYRRDLNGALVQFGSNNPELGELMKYPSFEESTAEVTVTNATKALVANNLNGGLALQCTGTGANARCCVEVPVPSERIASKVRHEVSCSIKADSENVKFVLRNDGGDRGFYDKDKYVVNKWSKLSMLVDPLGDIGFCIDQADTDVTLVDNCSITSNLSKRAAVDCARDVDCANDITFAYNGTTVVDQFGNSYGVTKNGSNNHQKLVSLSNLNLINALECSIGAKYIGFVFIAASSNSSVRFDTYSINDSTTTDGTFTATCTKTGSDYKTIPNRGVINVNMDAQNDTDWKSCGLVAGDFQGFGTPTGIDIKCRKDGADLLIDGAFTSGTTTGSEARLNLPSGLVSSSTLSGVTLAGRLQRSAVGVGFYGGGTVLKEPSLTYVTFGLETQSSPSPIDKRNGNDVAASGQKIIINARIPIQGWTARQEIVADLGFENIYQREETINATGSGDFTGGSLKVSRVGDQVSLTIISGITFPSLVTPTSAAGFIPSWARPQSLVSNIYTFISGTRANYLEVSPNGSVRFVLSDASAFTSSGSFTITYSVADNISSPAMIRSCIGTECENVFSATVAADGSITVSNVPNWISCTNADPRVCTFSSGIFTNTPVCAESTDASFSASQMVQLTGTTSTGVNIRTANGEGTSFQAPVSISCTKTGSDYKRSRTIVETTLEVPAIPYVSGGAELETGNTWDGEPIYRRCYEVASDITTSTTIATIPSGLNPVNSRNLSGDLWFIDNVTETATAYAWLYYNRTTGAIIGQGFGGYKIGAGSRFCLEYFK